MAINIITLGREAVVHDTYKKIDWIMCCFFFSLYSQSRLFKGNISSLPKVMQRNTDDPIGLKADLEATLNRFVGRFFTTLSVDVQIEDVDDSRFIVVIDVNVTDVKGDRPNVSVGYALTYRGSHLEKLLDRYNGVDLLNKQSR